MPDSLQQAIAFSCSVFGWLEAHSGILGVIVAIVTVRIALRQLKEWRKETPGKKKYEIALQYRRALFKLRDAVIDIRYPGFRPRELEGFSGLTEGSEEIKFPPPGAPDDEREKCFEMRSIQGAKERIATNEYVFYKRWQNMMLEYHAFQAQLLEAEVHDVKTDKQASVELDFFLWSIFDLFHLSFTEQQDDIREREEKLKEESTRMSPLPRFSEDERNALAEVGRLPPKEYTTEKTGSFSEQDKLEEDLLSKVNKLDTPIQPYLLKK